MAISVDYVPAEQLRALEMVLNARKPLGLLSALGGVAERTTTSRTVYRLNSEPLPETGDARIGNLLISLETAFRPIRHMLVGVWIHGSIATGDYTSYSDVDALVLLRDAVLQDAKDCQKMRAAIVEGLQAVLRFDPLQHHGFFVGIERALRGWPAAYLPGAALQFARPLWRPEGDVTLHEYADSVGSQRLFSALTNQILQSRPPRTLYQAKSLLSQFMLLPASYCQAADRPVYKRESFPIVKEEFAENWRAMEAATLIRAEWQIPRRPLWRPLLRIMNPWLASRLYRRLERRLPPCRVYNDWPDFILDMQRLAHAMKQRVA